LKPLSIFNYINGNRKKVLTLTFTIILSVTTVYYATLLAGSIFTMLESKYLPDQYYSTIYTNHFQKIEPSIVDELSEFADVIDVVPFIREYTLYDGLISAEGIPIMSLEERDTYYLMNKLKLTILEGRAPQATDEIILHERLAKNKGLVIGDFIGNEVNDKEQIKGKNQVVGIFQGEALIGFRYLPDDTEIQTSAMIFLKENNEGVTRYLEELAIQGYGASTLKLSKMYFDQTKSLINTILISIAGLIAIVVTLTLANISYIHLYHRKKEFSIRYVLGHSLFGIKLRTFCEHLIIIILGIIGGFILAIGLTLILNTLVFEPKGQHMIYIYLNGIPFVLLTPLVVLLINSFVTNKLLNKLDPIAILEGTD